MLSRHNFKQVLARDAQTVPHYGLRKLSIGVASVLLSTTLYIGVTAHADTVAQPTDSSIATAPASESNSAETPPVTAASTNNAATAHPADQSAGASTPTSTEVTKPTTAWQPEPTTNYSPDRVASIDTAGQPTTMRGDNWKMSLDKNYIKAGQQATLTVNYKAKAGDTFILDLGYPANTVNAQPLNSQVGTTTTKKDGLRTLITNAFKQDGSYTQLITLKDWQTSAEGLHQLRQVFGDQAFDLTLKYGTSAENAQDVGRIYLVSSFTPTMTGTGSVGVDQPDPQKVPVLSTNNNYIFSVRTNWSDNGTVLDPSYNGDFMYSVAVPKTFELDRTATEVFYQQIRNNEGYARWGNRGSNVTVSQAGVGAPVIIKASALDWVSWHYLGNEGVSFLGHFIDAPSVATTLTAEGQTSVSDMVGGHTQTITLPGLSAKVIKAADYDRTGDGITVFSRSDYGDHNQLYQSHEVPKIDSKHPIDLIYDLAVRNTTPFDVKDATVTLTFDDGLRVDISSVRNNSFISNLLADNYTHPNRENSLLVTYQDGTSAMVPWNSKGDLTKNIKSITLTRDWNSGQMAGLVGRGINGFVADTYQDGSPVKSGDKINVTLTVKGINTAGYEFAKGITDTLTVVDERFSPLRTESVWGGIDKTALGADPSGTINLKWTRTSGEHGKITLENPTIYFVMPNTVSQVKNIRWGGDTNLRGNAVPKLASIDYEQSKNGKNTVAIMRFDGTMTDSAVGNLITLYFDTVNKDNVVNQTSEGYLYWTADNVNTDGLTKVDPSRSDSQNKAYHLPANLSQDELNKIYLHTPFWGTINMVTGIYSTDATKTSSTPWQTETVVDYHGDGQADLGVNLVNDTSNELHNVVAIINLPKTTDSTHLAVSLTGNAVELIDPNTNQLLTDDVTVLYSTQAASLNSSDLSSFVPANQIKDWNKVQAVAVTSQSFAGMTSRQVRIPVVIEDLVALWRLKQKMPLN